VSKEIKEGEANTTNLWIPRGWVRARRVEEGWKPLSERKKRKSKKEKSE
jgi:hypothetical protein